MRVSFHGVGFQKKETLLKQYHYYQHTSKILVLKEQGFFYVTFCGLECIYMILYNLTIKINIIREIV